MTEIEEIRAEINRLSEILVRLTMEKALESELREIQQKPDSLNAEKVLVEMELAQIKQNIEVYT